VKGDSNKRDWIDICIKVLTPVVAGLLIAWAGFVSNYTLSSISSKKESARLITELQIRREQAESELRKDVFEQTLQAFLLKNQSNDNSVKGMSKQLLRLELLTLNFGDSLSLSPLFTEFHHDLKFIKHVEKEDRVTLDEDVRGLAKRLDSLARRVASNQVSSLVQHGVAKDILISLKGYIQDTEVECPTILYNEHIPWPEREVQRRFGIYNDKNKLQMLDEEIQVMFDPKTDTGLLTVYFDMLNAERKMSLQGATRYLEITIKDVDLCEKSAKITFIIYKTLASELQQPKEFPLIEKKDDLSLIGTDGLKVEVRRSFNLDYFNFPMVDNTRLEDSLRFAIVLDEFDLESDEPTIKLTGIIFPSEYASLRDRPGMKEARKLLKSALDDDAAD